MFSSYYIYEPMTDELYCLDCANQMNSTVTQWNGEKVRKGAMVCDGCGNKITKRAEVSSGT